MSIGSLRCGPKVSFRVGAIGISVNKTMIQASGNNKNPSEDRIPLGYCPHCDYQLVTVGICPECGQAVAQESLRSRPQFALVRRWGKHAVYIALIAGILFGAWRAYQSDFWLRRFSVERLASWSATYPRAQNELDRRLAAGELSLADLQLVVLERFEMNANIIEPRPRDLPLLVRFKPQRGILDLWCQARVRVLALRIDGEAATNLPPPMDYVFNLRGATSRHDPEIFAMTYHGDEPLPVGQHRLEADFEIEMCFGKRQEFYHQEIVDLTSSFTFQKSVTMPCRVVEQTSADLMIAQLTDDEVADLMNNVQICVGLNERENYLQVIPLGMRTAPLIGRFEVFRIKEKTPFLTLSSRAAEYHWRDRQVAGRWYLQADLNDAQLAPGEAIRLRFVPEPSAQYDDGYQSCFPLILEWDSITPHEINISDDPIARQSSNLQRVPDVKPDRGIRWSRFKDLEP